MQVGDAVDLARFWKMLADQFAIFRRVGDAMQIDEVELARLPPHYFFRRTVEGQRADVDAFRLQSRDRAGIHLQVDGRQQRDVVAQPLQRLDVAENRVRSRVAVQRGNAVVDD